MIFQVQLKNKVHQGLIYLFSICLIIGVIFIYYIFNFELEETDLVG